MIECLAFESIDKRGMMSKLNKKYLFLSLAIFAIFVGFVMLVSFVSPGVVMYNPVNGTSGENFTNTNVLFNVTLRNVTDLLNPVNATFYASLNGGGTWITIGNTSAAGCAIPVVAQASYNITCAVMLNFSIADGNYTINATVYNLSSGGGVNGTFGVNMSRSVTFDKTPPAIVANVTPTNGFNITNSTGPYIINISAIEPTTGVGVQYVFFNITNSSGAQVQMLNASNASINWRWNTYWNATWNLSAFKDDLYNITIWANDSLNNLNKTTVVQVRIDSIKPANANFTNPLSGQNKSGTISLNISAVDTSSSISAVMFNITTDAGVQQGVYFASKEAGDVWTYSLDTSAITDGNDYNVTAYVNDTAGNQNISSFAGNVTFDNSAPSFSSFSCTPDPINRDSVITCSCSGTDSISGVQTTSFTTNPSTANTGAISTSCSLTNYAGVTTLRSITYQVNQPAGGPTGSGGGSSTTTVTTKKVEDTLDKISPGSLGIVGNFDKDYGINQVSIDVKSIAQNVKVSITKYSDKPAAVSAITGKAYKYLDITMNNQDKLNKATVRIQVEKSWASANGINKAGVSMFHYVSGKWVELTTKYVSEDTTNYYYDTDVTSFSYFAIGQSSASITSGGETTGGENNTAGESGVGTTAKSKTLSIIIWVVIIILVIIAAVVIAMQMMKGKKRPNFR